LYSAARRHGCNVIALGHHREDLVETLMLNLLYAGQLQTMPPRMVNDAGDVVVIRPLATVGEALIRQFAVEQGFPIVPCTLCGRGKDLKRDRVGALIDALETEIPDVRSSIMTAMANVRKSHLLDSRIYDHKAAGQSLSSSTPPG